MDFATTAGDILTVYTTRPDTLFGATYMVISPEHPYIEKWADKIDQFGRRSEHYQEEAAKKSDFERTELVKDKTGVKIEGVMGINPVNGKEIPIFISDYVSDDLRYRRYHGSTGARYPRLGFCQKV